MMSLPVINGTTQKGVKHLHLTATRGSATEL
jgi:hypothetical protein